jgi:predicted enzyme related to lactoylglutathione lyase
VQVYGDSINPRAPKLRGLSEVVPSCCPFSRFRFSRRHATLSREYAHDRRHRYVHTNLIAHDWRRLAAFYESVLGCKVVPPIRDFTADAIAAGTGVPDASLSGVHLRLPGYGAEGPTIEIFAYSHQLAPPATAANRPGFAHIAFSVTSVPQARAAVIAAGGKAVGEVVTVTTAAGTQMIWCYVTDPEGNIIELQAAV